MDRVYCLSLAFGSISLSTREVFDGNNAGTTFDDFIAGSRQDELITITPGPDTLRRLARKDPEAVPRPIPLRLVKYVHGGTEFHLATTLLVSDYFPPCFR